eukprot:gene5475-7580_t
MYSCGIEECKGSMQKGLDDSTVSTVSTVSSSYKLNLTGDDFLMKSFVIKKNGKKGTWKRRFATLSGDKLSFSEEKDMVPHSVIDLSSCLSIRIIEFYEISSGKSCPNALELASTEGILLFHVESPELRRKWLEILSMVISELCFNMILRVSQPSFEDYSVPDDDSVLESNEGLIERISKLISSNSNINQAVDSHGRTLLYAASMRADSTLVKYLLKLGAKPNTYCTEMKLTALRAAVNINSSIIVQQLIAAKADVNKATKDGTTPLISAVESGSLDVVEVLVLSPEIMLNKSNKDGYTPIFIAASGGQREIALTLMQAGCDINVACKGILPVRVAKLKNNRVMVGILETGENHLSDIIGNVTSTRSIDSPSSRGSMFGNRESTVNRSSVFNRSSSLSRSSLFDVQARPSSIGITTNPLKTVSSMNVINKGILKKVDNSNGLKPSQSMGAIAAAESISPFSNLAVHDVSLTPRASAVVPNDYKNIY